MVTKLDASYHRRIADLRKRTIRLALARWDGLKSYRDQDFEQFLKGIVPRLEAAQVQTARITDAYLAQVSANDFGQSSALSKKLPDVSVHALRGVDAETVYRRPFVEVYTALSEGKALPGAVRLGRERLQSIVATNLELAKTHTNRAVMQSRKFSMYERTLSGSENCAMCVIASTQRYFVKDLQPIHPGCDCGQRPYVGPNVQVIHNDRLEDIHSTIESNFGGTDRGARYLDGRNEVSDYMDLIVTYPHGELGPVLAWRDQKHTIL